jgi:hypothetical protein
MGYCHPYSSSPLYANESRGAPAAALNRPYSVITTGPPFSESIRRGMVCLRMNIEKQAGGRADGSVSVF